MVDLLTVTVERPRLTYCHCREAIVDLLTVTVERTLLTYCHCREAMLDLLTVNYFLKLFIEQPVTQLFDRSSN